MVSLWLDQTEVQRRLSTFFEDKRGDFSVFGNTVNQTFEAFVFVSVAQWYASRGWKVEAVNAPREGELGPTVHLKFSTRGKPDRYTYFKAVKDGIEIQIRHQLRVATDSHKRGDDPPANVCLDVAVITSQDLSTFSSEDYIENSYLLTFGEAKHMSAFAELVAGFLGLVHELRPRSLRRKKRRPSAIKAAHPRGSPKTGQ